MDTLQMLERNYNTFIGREEPFAFFKGLADYLKYVVATPELNATIDANMAERDVMYAEVLKLEQQILLEVEASKKKLLSVIKKKKINTTAFKRFGRISSSELPDPVKELVVYETNQLGKSGWRSDNILHYLFEIAANIRMAGYENEIKELVASQGEYEEYHRRAATTPHYLILGNDHGTFIFSKTWPDRLRTEALIEVERKLKPWGAFEAMLRFKKAYDEVSKNGNFNTILQDVEETVMAIEDAVEEAFMAEDLQVLMGNGSDTYLQRYSGNQRKLDHLNDKEFRTYAQTVQNGLVHGLATQGKKVAIKSGPTHFDPETSVLYFRGDQIEISKNRNSDPHYLLSILFRDSTKTWAFDEIWEDPYFRSGSTEYNPKIDWKKIYQAGYAVNEKVQKATKIRGFLTLSKTTIAVSRDFLS